MQRPSPTGAHTLAAGQLCEEAVKQPALLLCLSTDSPNLRSLCCLSLQHPHYSIACRKTQGFFRKCGHSRGFSPLFTESATEPHKKKRKRVHPTGEPFWIRSLSQIQKPNVKPHTFIRRTYLIAVSIQMHTPVFQYAGQLQLLSRWIDLLPPVLTYRHFHVPPSLLL